MSQRYELVLEFSEQDGEWVASFTGEPFFSALSDTPETAVKNLLEIDKQWWSDARKMESK